MTVKAPAGLSLPTSLRALASLASGAPTADHPQSVHTVRTARSLGASIPRVGLKGADRLTSRSGAFADSGPSISTNSVRDDENDRYDRNDPL
ncbi:hypothetical protein GCM10009000_028480 [Halobacterium noricense]